MDRRSHVESVIIKFMKKVKTVEYEEMIAGVLPLLRFNQGRVEVEARLEFLFKRGNLDLIITEADVDDAPGGDKPVDVANNDSKMDVDEEAKLKKRIIKYSD